MSSQRSVFYQTCPVCGRSLRMSVDAFGRHVTCVHCGGELRASGGELSPPAAAGQTAPLSLLPMAFVEDCFPEKDFPAAGPQ